MNRVTDMVIVGTTIMYAVLALFFALTGIALPTGILRGNNSPVGLLLGRSLHTLLSRKPIQKRT